MGNPGIHNNPTSTTVGQPNNFPLTPQQAAPEAPPPPPPPPAGNAAPRYQVGSPQRQLGGILNGGVNSRPPTRIGS